MQCADNRIVRSARLSLYESVLLRSTKMANLRKKSFSTGQRKQWVGLPLEFKPGWFQPELSVTSPFPTSRENNHHYKDKRAFSVAKSNFNTNSYRINKLTLTLSLKRLLNKGPGKARKKHAKSSTCSRMDISSVSPASSLNPFYYNSWETLVPTGSSSTLTILNANLAVVVSPSK